MHLLIVAKQWRGPRLLLGEVGQAVSAPANLGLSRVARITTTTSSGSLDAIPLFRGIRPHCAEAVLGNFSGGSHGHLTHGHISNPAIGKPDVLHDQLIKARSLVDKELREIAGLQYAFWTAHKSKKFKSSLNAKAASHTLSVQNASVMDL
jgi:hypothetical protein